MVSALADFSAGRIRAKPEVGRSESSASTSESCASVLDPARADGRDHDPCRWENPSRCMPWTDHAGITR